MEALIKGNQIIISSQFLVNKYGPDSIEKAAQIMDPKNREIVLGDILSSSWKPAPALVELAAAADKVFGKGDYEVCREMGYFTAKESMSKFYKVFLKFGDPFFILKRSNTLVKQMHNTGRIEVIETGPSYIKAHYLDFGYPHKAFCLILLGFFYGVLEMCGTKNLLIEETRCVNEGDEVCEFVATWKK